MCLANFTLFVCMFECWSECPSCPKLWEYNNVDWNFLVIWILSVSPFVAQREYFCDTSTPLVKLLTTDNHLFRWLWLPSSNCTPNQILPNLNINALQIKFQSSLNILHNFRSFIFEFMLLWCCCTIAWAHPLSIIDSHNLSCNFGTLRIFCILWQILVYSFAQSSARR